MLQNETVTQEVTEQIEKYSFAGIKFLNSFSVLTTDEQKNNFVDNFVNKYLQIKTRGTSNLQNAKNYWDDLIAKDDEDLFLSFSKKWAIVSIAENCFEGNNKNNEKTQEFYYFLKDNFELKMKEVYKSFI